MQLFAQQVSGGDVAIIVPFVTMAGTPRICDTVLPIHCLTGAWWQVQLAISSFFVFFSACDVSGCCLLLSFCFSLEVTGVYRAAYMLVLLFGPLGALAAVYLLRFGFF